MAARVSRLHRLALDAALASLLLGDATEAQALAAAELELARAFGAPHALGVALRTAGLAASDREKSHALLEESVDTLR